MLILKKGIKVYDEIIELQLLKHHIIEQKSLLPSCQNSKKKTNQKQLQSVRTLKIRKQYRNSRATVAKIVSDASNNANRKMISMQIENTKDITFPSFHLKMILTTFANVFTNHSNETMKNEQWQQYTEKRTVKTVKTCKMRD